MRPRGRLAILLLGVAALVAGIAGGLLRAGVAMPLGGDLPRSAAAFHATLMISGFFGTVIGIERAVAVRERAAFAAPLASGLGAMLTLAGLARAGAALGVLAALAFVLVNILIVRRQPAAHTAVLLVGAVAWLVGSVAVATGIGAAVAARRPARTP